MSAPAGWYDDGSGAARWWDGYRWVEGGPARQASQEFSPVPEGTSSNTAWVWLIVLLPLLSTIAAFGYLLQMQQGMFDVLALVPLDGSSSMDVEGLIAAEFGMFLTPWYLVLLVSGWAIYGLSAWFAALDVRDLAARGFVRPFPWAWSFLSPLVYVIGRHVVIRRRGGRGSAPLIVTLVIQGMTLIGVTVWTSVFVSQIVETVFSMVTMR